MKIIITVFMVLFVLGARARSQQKNEQIMVDGIGRKFVTYLPSITNPAERLPVIISLHGRFGTGKSMMGFADFRPIADREKFIIVCPDGIDRSWNAGGPTPAEKKGINDVKFIGELITYLVKTYAADSARVYVTGMSNGGFMSSRLACELNSRIAAIAVVGASMNKNREYQPKNPIPVLYIQGTGDPLVPFGGGNIKGGPVDEICAHEQVLKLWAETDKCAANPVITNLPDNAHDGTTVIKEVYSNAATHVKVVGYTIVNGGHTWPDGQQYLPKFIIGRVSHNLDACEVIWEFFKGYRLGE